MAGEGAGRPEYEIDWKKVDNLLVAGCKGSEIAGEVGISASRLYDRVREKFGINFTEYAQSKYCRGDGLLRAKRFHKAMEGSIQCLLDLCEKRVDVVDDNKKAPNQTEIDKDHLIMELQHKLTQFIDLYGDKSQTE